MEIRKLGTYLIENKSCDDEIIKAALHRQLALERQGMYKPLGEILIEVGGLNPETLDFDIKAPGGRYAPFNRAF